MFYLLFSLAFSSNVMNRCRVPREPSRSLISSGMTVSKLLSSWISRLYLGSGLSGKKKATDIQTMESERADFKHRQRP